MSKIVIDTDVLSKITKEGDKFIFDPSAEGALLEFLNFQEKVEEAAEMVRQVLSERMEQFNTTKIDGESVRASKQFYGSRFEISDPELAESLGFANKRVSLTPDSKAIEKALKDTEELPAGIKLRDRVAKVTIKKVVSKKLES